MLGVTMPTLTTLNEKRQTEIKPRNEKVLFGVCKFAIAIVPKY